MGRLKMTAKEMRLIIGAVMQPESIAGKVKGLKNITFCTDEVKFEDLSMSGETSRSG